MRKTPDVLIEDYPLNDFFVTINDLKFFETDLTAGNHIIRVEYVAGKWTDYRGWIKEYSFRYVLSPAKYWKSFGSLEISIDASNFNGTLISNLNKPITGNIQTYANWTFSDLPTEVIHISYKPTTNWIANTLITISPLGLTLLFALILILIHLKGIKLFRKTNLHTRFSWVIITGSILIPFIILLVYILSFELIDIAIGKEAGKYHGYTFIVLLLYPVLLPVYWIIMWLLDRKMTRNLRKIKK